MSEKQGKNDQVNTERHIAYHNEGSFRRRNNREMWNRSGRSSALDRAEALLSAKKRKEDKQSSTLDCSAKTQGYVIARSAPPNTHTWSSDVPDPSSDSTASVHGTEDNRAADVKEEHETETRSSKDIRPQSSLGGGSRFIKKAPKPINSSQSPVSKNQMHQKREPSGSQAAALSRLSEIESRINSRKQTLEEARQATKAAINLTSDLRMSVTAAIQSTEAPEQLSAHSSSEQSQKKNRFLKQKAVAPILSDVGGRSRARTTDPVGLKMASARVISGVSLESDEEDIRELLGDSMDSSNYSSSESRKTSSMKRLKKELNSPSQRVQSPALPTAVHPLSRSNTPPPLSTASPSRHSSPFRFTGQAQVHFSPSVLSPSPSPPPPNVSPSRSKRIGSSHKAGSPQESLLSLSEQVFSLEELIPARPTSEYQHSQMGSVSSGDFQVNLMTLDELLPASAGFTAETPGIKPSQSQSGHISPVPGSHHIHQEEEQQPHYQSDFESDSSVRQVSKHTRGHGDEDEVLSEVTKAPSPSDGSHETTEDDYSHALSDLSCSSTSQASNHSQRSESSSSASPGSRSLYQPSRKQTLARKALKDAATQTRLDPLADLHSAGAATLDLAVSRLYMNPPPVVAHAVSAERLEGISSFSPVLFALNEMLKQQLNMTRQFINHSDQLHSRLLRDLDPPNYRYTTLEDTIQNIRRHRTPRL
ncbi:uncharacterized protein C19orf44 homolog isoform X2 [Kryptolebias marmoratus]|uniref:uncharacterized protein C19orf44 homolog isoform X2 n=1 Tax=Kryptolebias marmoratus TaxID=37003 RepID=UPI0007F8C659|nr:uncharacterized protein C19orf44 homolog isoform X2 [Kryptolebias marmoratus]